MVPFKRAKEAGFSTHFSDDLGFPDEFVYQKPTGLTQDILVPEDAWSPDARRLGALRYRLLLRRQGLGEEPLARWLPRRADLREAKQALVQTGDVSHAAAPRRLGSLARFHDLPAVPAPNVVGIDARRCPSGQVSESDDGGDGLRARVRMSSRHTPPAISCSPASSATPLSRTAARIRPTRSISRAFPAGTPAPRGTS